MVRHEIAGLTYFHARPIACSHQDAPHAAAWASASSTMARAALLPDARNPSASTLRLAAVSPDWRRCAYSFASVFHSPLVGASCQSAGSVGGAPKSSTAPCGPRAAARAARCVGSGARPKPTSGSARRPH